MFCDAYAKKYQKKAGFKIHIQASENKDYLGYLSLKPSTRSTYDIAMRDATIDGLVTMDEINRLKAGQIFYRETQPNELFILQSVNEFEQQKDTRSINAIKQNSFTTIQRKQYNEETGENEYMDIYEDVISFVTMQSKDGKNFAAGIEDNTILTIQIPKFDREENKYIAKVEDRVILKDLGKDITREVKIESVNEFSVPGVVVMSGTFDTRTGD